MLSHLAQVQRQKRNQSEISSKSPVHFVSPLSFRVLRHSVHLLYSNVLVQHCQHFIYQPFIIRLWLITIVVPLDIHNTKWGFLQVQRNTKEIYEKIEKIINPVIIYYYNDHSGSDRESHTSLSFLDYFLLVLPGPLCPCQVTGLPTTDPMVISPSLQLILVTWDLTLFCLGSFRSCFYHFLRLFVTPLFLIIVDQF